MKNLLLMTVTFFSIIWFSVSVCSARDANGLAAISGIGVVSCGKMTEDIKMYPNYADLLYQNYIDGFLSGYNLGAPGKADFVEGSDFISRYKFVFKYCEDNPLRNVSAGIIKLIKQYNENI